MNTDNSLCRRFRTVLGMMCVLALVPCGRVFAQIPSMERGLYDAQIGPDRPEAIYPHLDDEAGLGRPHTVANGRPVSGTVTLHELSHRVPGRAVKDYERALKATKGGERDNAIVHFHKAIAADPEFLAAITNLGVTYLELNRVDLAFEQFAKAIAVDPHAALPHVNLAIAYLRLGLFSDAEQAARRAVSLDRVGKYARLILGVSSIMKGSFTAETERSLTEAAREYTVAKLWLAIGLFGSGDFTSAKDQLKTYIGQADNDNVEFATRLLQELESVDEAVAFAAKTRN